jgi:3-methyl-2-oxobutanoate hydroxymethyltransferase
LAFRLSAWKAFLFLEGESMGEKVTVPDIIKKKRQGEIVTCLTAYDYSFARILDQAGIDILLVGDSVGCVFRGRRIPCPSPWTR